MLVFVAAGNPTLGDGTSLMVGDAVETDGGVSLGGTGTVVVFVLDPRSPQAESGSGRRG
jgi:hypothetical protein